MLESSQVMLEGASRGLEVLRLGTKPSRVTSGGPLEQHFQP